MKNRALGAAVVVMEGGSEWPAWIDELRPSTSSTRVIVELSEESPTEFAERVIDRVGEVTTNSADLSVAVVACSERHDEVALEARRNVARAILSAMSKAADESSAGRLMFTAGERQSGRARHALTQLVSDLCSEWQSSALEVCVRFGTERLRPGEVAEELLGASDTRVA